LYLPRAIVQTVFSSTKLILKTKSASANSVGGSFLCSCKTLEVTISILDETAINLETNYTRSCYPRENIFEIFVWQFLLFIFSFPWCLFLWKGERLSASSKTWSLCEWWNLISKWWQETHFTSSTQRQNCKYCSFH